MTPSISKSLIVACGFCVAIFAFLADGLPVHAQSPSWAKLPLPSYSGRPAFARAGAFSPSPTVGLAAWEASVRHFYPGFVVDPGTQDHGPETVRMTYVDTIENLAPLPTDQSSAVVVADIRTAHAAIASHGTAVYTMYEADVSSWIKSSSPKTITLFQLGGTIRFPSGHIRHFLISDQGFLSPGGRYLLFLSALDDGPSWKILTAYLVSGGQVFALSDNGPQSDLNGLPLATVVERTQERQ
jgi:hypothetical protein